MIFFFNLLGFLSLGASSLPANDQPNDSNSVVSKSAEPDFVGVKSCQSTACHGGATAWPASPTERPRGQCLIWNQQDPHSHAFATLTTNYSARIIDSLNIQTKTTNPAAPVNVQCTTCHVHPGYIPSDNSGPQQIALSGVSCEVCHNSAQNWLRFHTRLDATYSQKVSIGLRDLRNADIRAETCVICHQVINPDLIKAGHPSLEFELDRLTEDEPPHWREKEDWFGPKAWLVGQAVALRAVSEQLTHSGGVSGDLKNQEKTLQWLLRLIPNAHPPEFDEGDSAKSESWSGAYAKSIAQESWSDKRTKEILLALAASSSDFGSSGSTPSQFLRAERLVQGLDRLSKCVAPAVRPEISLLYSQVSNPSSFESDDFSATLKKLSNELSSAAEK